jgi:hypothetical protein
MSTDNEASSGAADDMTKVDPAPGDSPAEQAEKLEATVEAARDDLGELVSELDRRRHRATKLVPIGAIAVAILGVGGYILWRVLRAKPSRLQRLGEALERATTHPESVAKEQPNAAKKILVAAASAAAAVAARRAVTRWSAARPGEDLATSHGTLAEPGSGLK